MTAECKINGQKWKLWKKEDDKRVTHKYWMTDGLKKVQTKISYMGLIVTKL